MGADADVVVMDSTHTPTTTDPTTRRLVKLLAVVAIFALAFCAWSMWASARHQSQRDGDCLAAQITASAAGRPSTYTPPACR